MEAGNGVVSPAKGFLQQVCALGVCVSFIPGTDTGSVALLPAGWDWHFLGLKYFSRKDFKGKQTNRQTCKLFWEHDAFVLTEMFFSVSSTGKRELEATRPACQ